MFHAPTSSGPALPAVKTAAVGVLAIIERYIVPIAGFMGGVSMGYETALETGRFLTEFVPGVDRMNNWVAKLTFQIHIQLLIAGVILLFIAAQLDILFSTFLGDFTITRIASRGAMAFVFGIGVRAIIEGFTPLSVALEAVGTSLPEVQEGGDLVEKGIITPIIPTPAPIDEGGKRGTGDRRGSRYGGGGGELPPYTGRKSGMTLL